MTMTAADVRNVLRAQLLHYPKATNDHGVTLDDALVPPQRISIIERTVQKGQLSDKLVTVWLVGQERSSTGYRIVMREDSSVFVLASAAFPADRHLVLVGLYGDLISAFINM
jgi:hypothetical protein